MNSPPRKQAEAGLFKEVWREYNRMIDYLREISPLNGLGIQTNRTANGTTFNLKPTAPIDPGSSQNQYLVKEVFGDYLRCRSWNYNADGDGFAGEEDIFIARPWRERQSIFDGQSIAFDEDGDIYTATYTYLSPTRRVKTVTGEADETQVIVPGYKVDFDVIYAMRCEEVTGVTTEDDQAVTLVDNNNCGRAWARARIQAA